MGTAQWLCTWNNSIPCCACTAINHINVSPKRQPREKTLIFMSWSLWCCSQYQGVDTFGSMTEKHSCPSKPTQTWMAQSDAPHLTKMIGPSPVSQQSEQNLHLNTFSVLNTKWMDHETYQMMPYNFLQLKFWLFVLGKHKSRNIIHPSFRWNVLFTTNVGQFCRHLGWRKSPIVRGLYGRCHSWGQAPLDVLAELDPFYVMLPELDLLDEVTKPSCMTACLITACVQQVGTGDGLWCTISDTISADGAEEVGGSCSFC